MAMAKSAAMATQPLEISQVTEVGPGSRGILLLFGVHIWKILEYRIYKIMGFCSKVIFLLSGTNWRA